MDDAVRMLERAIATDSTLAPAWEHLTWALIRAGDGERAGVALAHLSAGPTGGVGIHLPDFLRMAYAFRFGDPKAQAEVQAGWASLSKLALAARGGCRSTCRRHRSGSAPP